MSDDRFFGDTLQKLREARDKIERDLKKMEDEKLKDFPKPWVKRPEPIHVEEIPDWWITDLCDCGCTWGISKNSFSRMPAVVFGMESEVLQIWRAVLGNSTGGSCPNCGADEPKGSIVRLMYIPPPKEN